MAEPPHLLIIYTGGTVGMVFDPTIQALLPVGFSTIQKAFPEMSRLGYRLTAYHFDPPIDSSDMDPQTWLQLARLIETQYEQYDGFVILHGTDTMAFTASALSFLLEGLNKAVVLTGSQLPIGSLRTDARENIITSIEIAAAKNEKGEARVPEVSIFFDNKLFRGNRARKYDAEKFSAFFSMNYPALAEAGINIHYSDSFILPVADQPFRVHQNLNPQIAVLRLFPGITEESVEAILQTKGLKGLVLETFGSGNASTQNWFLGRLKQAAARGIIILNITQCDGGSVTMGLYETSVYLKEMGVTTGFDLTFEAAVTKMMFVLGLNQSEEKSKKLLQQPLRGELTPIRRSLKH